MKDLGAVFGKVVGAGIRAAEDAAYERAAAECEKWAASIPGQESTLTAAQAAQYCADFIRAMRSDA